MERITNKKIGFKTLRLKTPKTLCTILFSFIDNIKFSIQFNSIFFSFQILRINLLLIHLWLKIAEFYNKFMKRKVNIFSNVYNEVFAILLRSSFET